MSLNRGLRNPTFLGSMRPRAIALADDFNRADSTDLGATSVGERDWVELRGDWSISSNRIVGPDNGAAVVETYAPDFDMTVDISTGTTGGRDALVFRATDENNYWLLEYTKTVTSSTSCTDVYEYSRYCYNLADECIGVWPSTRYFYKCGSCPSCNACYQASFNCNQTSTVCDTNCTTSYSTSYRARLTRRELGVDNYVNQWATGTSSPQLRVRAVGSTIELSYPGYTGLQSVTSTFNQDATLHGVGRGFNGNRTASALDNFSFTPLS